jgi:phosphoglycolate phosphatase
MARVNGKRTREATNLSLPGIFPILAPMSQEFSGLIEFAASFEPRPEISHVVFDFDGTLSLIREGWPVVMLGMFQEMLPGRAGDIADAVRQMLFDDMMKLNGKQTIYQMIQFADRVKERGGTPQEPLWYKHEYLRRLNQKIDDRIVGLKRKSIEAERYLVFGSVALLEDLKRRGMKLYLASGTDEQFVKAEADLLGLTKYFGEHIYGAKDDYKSFSKKMVIDRLLIENGIDGRKLLAFGDGYVEIQNTKEVGGLAIAVASDEACNGSGRIDEWKRNRLVGVGADVVIPDYRDAAPFLRKILCK